MKTEFRKQHFVDSPVQRSLVRRAILYWFWCLVTVFVAMTCWRVLLGPPATYPQYAIEVWQRCSPVFFAFLLLLPVIVVDVVHTSHRIVGPFRRLRNTMRLAGTGVEVPQLKFRNTDLVDGIANDFNAMINRYEERLRFEDTLEEDRDSAESDEVPV